jgi:hypothetical protein
MTRIRLALNRLSLSERIAKARQIVAALTGNASFPTPTPDLRSMTIAIDEADAAAAEALQARQTAKEKTSVQNQKDEALSRMLSQIAAYVESVAGDDEQKILSAGMDTRERAVAATAATSEPQGLSVSAGDRDGELDLSWDKVTGAKSYVVEKSGDPPTATGWSHAGVSTKSTFTVSGLASGTRYWFRVAAVNTSGQSGWSDPAMKIAP